MLGRKRKINTKYFLQIEETDRDGRKWKKTEKWKEAMI